MSEIESIGIALVLDNGVAEGLRRISRDMAVFNHQTELTAARMSRIAQLHLGAYLPREAPKPVASTGGKPSEHKPPAVTANREAAEPFPHRTPLPLPPPSPASVHKAPPPSTGTASGCFPADAVHWRPNRRPSAAPSRCNSSSSATASPRNCAGIVKRGAEAATVLSCRAGILKHRADAATVFSCRADPASPVQPCSSTAERPAADVDFARLPRATAENQRDAIDAAGPDATRCRIATPAQGAISAKRPDRSAYRRQNKADGAPALSARSAPQSALGARNAIDGRNSLPCVGRSHCAPTPTTSTDKHSRRRAHSARRCGGGTRVFEADQHDAIRAGHTPRQGNGCLVPSSRRPAGGRRSAHANATADFAATTHACLHKSCYRCAPRCDPTAIGKRPRRCSARWRPGGALAVRRHGAGSVTAAHFGPWLQHADGTGLARNTTVVR